MPDHRFADKSKSVSRDRRLDDRFIVVKDWARRPVSVLDTRRRKPKRPIIVVFIMKKCKLPQIVGNPNLPRSLSYQTRAADDDQVIIDQHLAEETGIAPKAMPYGYIDMISCEIYEPVSRADPHVYAGLPLLKRT